MNAKQRRKARRAAPVGFVDVYFGPPQYTQPVTFTAKELGIPLGKPPPWEKLTEALRRVQIVAS